MPAEGDERKLVAKLKNAHEMQDKKQNNQPDYSADTDIHMSSL
jgi:hypothetical protein